MTRHRTVRIALVALALATAAPKALAQEEVAESREQEEAETAFLRAYYLEVGKHDFASALAAYERVLAEHPDAAVSARAWLGSARCLRQLGRHAEARSLLARIMAQHPEDAATLAAARRLADALGAAGGDEELASLVLRALREDAWLSKTPEFGEPAVPTLARLLRSADPEIVGRAAASLRRIGAESALDALVAALAADDIRYRDQMLQIGLGTGPIPKRVGRALSEVEDVEVRRSIIRSALLTRTPQPWLVDLVLEHEWARKAAFRDERKAWDGLGWLTEMVVAAGPGPARDAAVAHMRLYEPDRPKRSWGFKGAQALASPSAEFLKDREAVRVVAHHVLCDYRGPPSPALRDALLADPDTQRIALEWTWRHKLPCAQRELLVAALEKDWHFDVSRLPTSLVAEVLGPSFDPPPTREEWARILPSCQANVWDLIKSFAQDDFLPSDTLDALLDAGKPAHVLAWCAQKGVKDTAWAARALPPLLRSEDPDVAVSAASILTQQHGLGRMDASGYVDDLVALFEIDRFWSRGPQALVVMLTEMGPAARAAVVEAVPVGGRADEFILQRSLALELPEAAEVARRLILVDATEDHDPRLGTIDDAVEVLLRVRADDAVPTLLEAVRTPPRLRQLRVAAQTWHSQRHLSSRALEAFMAPLIEDRPEGISFPRSVGGLDADAVRRLSLRALASDDPHLQAWGAQRQESALDPAAAGRLGELAESADPAVRASARSALTAMRKADEDMAWMRAVAARRATRDRVDALLASESPVERMAGVAGLVALRAPDALERLLHVAAGDTDPDVRAEARRALISIGERGGARSGVGK